MRAKYVMTNNGCIIFPGSFSHADFKHFNPTSAGTVSIHIDANKITASCYGESITLNLKSDPHDSDIITRQILKDY